MARSLHHDGDRDSIANEQGDGHDPGRRRKADQGEGNHVLRPALHGHARQGAARHHPDAHGGRGLLRRRQDVRRLLDRRLEGHQRVRHDPDAGSVDGDDRSVLRGDDAAPALRRRRADDDAGLQPRPALAREARRGLPPVHGHRRLLPVRPRERVLHLRQRALDQRDARLQLQHRFGAGRLELRHGLRRTATWAIARA